MSDARHQQQQSTEPNPEKPTEDWVTGDEPMTGPQRSYLETLAREAGEGVPSAQLTKAQASEEIERLQGVTGRGDWHEPSSRDAADDPQLPLDNGDAVDSLVATPVIVPDQEAG